MLGERQHQIRLGTYPHVFRVIWHPVVLTFSFSSKQQKNKDPLASVRSRLEPLDIKAIMPYVIDETTHVVASKRNTAKGLQALINAKFIVSDTFVDAVIESSRPPNAADPESSSPLEDDDFDTAWPDALQHLPTQGEEPSQRPTTYFAPDPNRSNVFEGYSFVFCDSTQFDNLQAPITNAGGKALLFELKEQQTSPQEIVQYVKSVAGEKHEGAFGDGSEGKGVVVVRFRGPREHEEWSIEVGNEVARSLDQRLIEQSEFLDAILVNDASGLRKPLSEEDDDGSNALPSPPIAAPPSRTNPVSERTARPGPNETTSVPIEGSGPPAKRLRSRRPVVSKFKGFEDGFDPSSFPQTTLKPEKSSQIDEIDKVRVSSQCLAWKFLSWEQSAMLDFPGMEVDSAASNPPGGQDRSRKKRGLPQSEDDNEDDEDVMDEILPAATAMKRQRLEKGTSPARAAKKSTAKAGPEPTGKSRKARREVNLLEVAREHREAKDEAMRRDREALEETLGGMDVEQMKNLALVEAMPVKQSSDRASRTDAYGDGGKRWDDRWNGRKNFKKFRRAGDAGNQARRGRSVIVGFEEVRRKDFGIGEEYWIESERSKKTRDREKEGRHGGQSQSQSQSYATARGYLATSEAEDQDMPQVVEGPRKTQLADKTKVAQEFGSATQDKGMVTKGKRAASGTMTNPAPSKKQKTLFVRDSESDDSEDELRFRFKKKR